MSYTLHTCGFLLNLQMIISENPWEYWKIFISDLFGYDSLIKLYWWCRLCCSTTKWCVSLKEQHRVIILENAKMQAYYNEHTIDYSSPGIRNTQYYEILNTLYKYRTLVCIWIVCMTNYYNTGTILPLVCLQFAGI